MSHYGPLLSCRPQLSAMGTKGLKLMNGQADKPHMQQDCGRPSGIQKTAEDKLFYISL